MPTDLSRTTRDHREGYEAVVLQQGRVILDRDFNALQNVVDGRIAADALAEIGPFGTPDGGFLISLPTSGAGGIANTIARVGPDLVPIKIPITGPFPIPIPITVTTPTLAPLDFSIGAGTLFVGGRRVAFPAQVAGQAPWTYFNQPDWINPDPPAAFAGSTPPATATATREFIYLDLTAQEVGGCEDPDLLEVALGGPDTTARVRLMRRVARLPVSESACAGAATDTWAQLLATGYQLDPATMRLLPQATLQVGFGSSASTTDPCDSVVQGGYLGADNQLIRVQIAASAAAGQAQLLWGYDNASVLYRVATAADPSTVVLLHPPVDTFHYPQPGQVVEILRTEAVLGVDPDGTDPTGHRTIVRCVARPSGMVATVTSFQNETLALGINPPLPAAYLADANLATPLPLFVRIWQGQQAFNPASTQPIPLTDPTSATSPGIQVTIAPTAGTMPVGASWVFAVRPSTPQAVYPQRYLEAPQPPDGPVRWACPLAVINWAQPNPQFSPALPVSGVASDCRPPFLNLVGLTARDGPGTGLVDGVFSFGPYGGNLVLNDGDTMMGADLARGLNVLLNRAVDPSGVGPASCSVTLDLPVSLSSLVVGSWPFQPAAVVQAGGPSVLAWEPGVAAQALLAYGLPNSSPIGPVATFSADWDAVASGGASLANWQYFGGAAEANGPAAPTQNNPNQFAGNLAIAKALVEAGASTLTASAVPSFAGTVNFYKTGSFGIVFNYVSSNDFWLMWAAVQPSGQTILGNPYGHVVTAYVARYVLGLAPQIAQSSPTPVNYGTVSRVDFRIALGAAGSPPTFAATVSWNDGSAPIALNVIPATPPTPSPLAAGSRVGLYSNWPGQADFSLMEVGSPSFEPQFLLPPAASGRLLARLTVRPGLLRPAAPAVGSAATAGPSFASMPDFHRWFWVIPGGGVGYGYLVGGPGLGAMLI